MAFSNIHDGKAVRSGDQQQLRRAGITAQKGNARLRFHDPGIVIKWLAQGVTRCLADGTQKVIGFLKVQSGNRVVDSCKNIVDALTGSAKCFDLCLEGTVVACLSVQETPQLRQRHVLRCRLSEPQGKRVECIARLRFQIVEPF